MEFNLKKNLCFFDIEATGLHVIRDRIIQIAIMRYHADGSPPMEYQQLINPGIPISEEAMEITGITPGDLRNKPTFAQVAEEIFNIFGDADLAGYNSNRFDIPMLMEEFARAGLDFTLDRRNCIDVQRIFYRMEPRTLSAAHKFYTGTEMANSHDAMEDVKATVAVLKGQLEKYEGVDVEDDEEVLSAPVQNDMSLLHDFTNDPKMLDVTQRLKYKGNGEIVFNFGRYQGQAVKEVFRHDPDYYHWIQKKEFSVQVKRLTNKIYKDLNAEYNK